MITSGTRRENRERRKYDLTSLAIGHNWDSREDQEYRRWLEERHEDTRRL